MWDLAFQRNEIDYAQLRYGDAIKGLRRLHGQMTRSVPAVGEDTADLDNVLWLVEDRLVRALVRTRQLGKALKVALAAQARLRGQDSVSLLPLVVHAHRADIKSARAAVHALIAAEEPFERIFEDEDTASILAGAAYKDLREKYSAQR